MKSGITKQRSFEFAKQVVHSCEKLKTEKKEFILSKQLLRSGTAIGSMVREAEFAESRVDFIHKLSIAQKECNETIYWIDLLYETNYLDKNAFESLKPKGLELMRLLTSSLKTAKRNNSLKKSSNH